MATYRHTIEVEARFVDNLSGEADDASRSISGVGKSAKKAKEDVDRLGKSKANPNVGIDTSKFTRAMDKINNLLDKFKKVHTAALNIKDSNAYQKIKKVTDAVEGLTKKTWSVIVKVKDIAMAPFNAVRRALFNIQTLATAIFAGIAAKTAIINPIGVADAYSSAKIGFSTLLGESGGQKMMDQLDQFAKATPFKTTNVIANAQKMMAMGWGTDTLLEDMETIGNAAAATGKLDQGLESIVRALAQIKTKGKLSTEELNQLSEAGIAAKSMLAEQLGYGTGDSGIAAMSADLEDGVIGADQAIQALLAGMKKYDGMMDSMANETVEGLISQMQDAFEINIVRKWGQGLQDGAKRGFGTVIELLDKSEEALSEFGDMLYEIGHTASNFVADKFENMIKRILAVSDTFDFKNASIGGKISMLWKGVIVDPIKEWWEDGGRQKTIESAGEIGAWMGETLTKGLLAVFGITDFLKGDGEELSIGAELARSFSDSFRENFDASAVTDKLVEAVGNVWNAIPAWAKVLLVGYGGSKLAIGGMNVISSIAGAVDSFGSFVGKTGVYGVGGSGLLGGLSKFGYAASGAVGGTAGKAALLGIGGGTAALAGAGALATAAGVIKSGVDLYQAYKAHKAGDKVTRNANLASGGSTLAGAGIGAGIGSMILPGVGTLIGAGIGTAVGWFVGDRIAKNIESAKYQAEGLADAFKDAETAEEKAAVYAEALYNNARRHFGDIKLSLSEITQLANSIVWGDDLAAFDQFTAATKSAESSVQTLKNTAEATNKWLWKSGLRLKFEEDDKESMIASFNEYIASAQAYVENKHYEFSTSASLLLDPDSVAGGSIIANGNAFYTKVSEELDKAGEDLGNKLIDALADGIISAKEERVILEAQRKIAEITEKISNAETTAELELIKVKWTSGNMDYESFEKFMDQMETTINERVAAADDAFKIQVSNLALQFPDGGTEYETALNELIGGYKAKVESVKADVMDVELDIIGSAFNEELGWDASSKLKNVLSYALKNNVDPVLIDDETLSKLIRIDVDSLSGVTADNLRNMLSDVFNQVGLLSVDGSVLLNLTPETNIVEDVDIGAGDFGIFDTIDHSVLVKIEGNKVVDPLSLSMSDFGIRSTYTATPTVKLAPRFVSLLDDGTKGYADGGFVKGGAQLITVAEEGTPEAIIPLGSNRRGRGLELWKKAGEMLGVKNLGRIMTGSGDEGIRYNSNNVGAGELSNSVSVSLGGVNVSIQVDASGSDNVAEVIKAQSGEIAETVAEMLAAELGAQFENTPAKGGVA